MFNILIHQENAKFKRKSTVKLFLLLAYQGLFMKEEIIIVVQ